MNFFTIPLFQRFRHQNSKHPSLRTQGRIQDYRNICNGTLTFSHFREEGHENIKKCVEIQNSLWRFFSQTCNYDENLIILMKILNTPPLAIVTKTPFHIFWQSQIRPWNSCHWLLYFRHNLPSSIPMDSATFVHVLFSVFM